MYGGAQAEALPQMKLESALMAAVAVGTWLGAREVRAERVSGPWLERGQRELGAAGFMSRILAAGTSEFAAQDNSGWAPGLLASYGYAATRWFTAEGEAFIAVGRFTEHRFIATGVLAGATFYYPSASRVVPFAGLRLGIGRMKARNSDGGNPTETTFVIAPKAGVLVRLSEQAALQVSVEYRGNYIMGLSGYDYGHRHLIAVPIGIALAF